LQSCVKHGACINTTKVLGLPLEENCADAVAGVYEEGWCE
jgi:hypothetical protein